MTGAAAPFWELLCFPCLILGMALIPLFAEHWWKRWYPALAAVVAVPCAVSVAVRDGHALMLAGEEYLSFILLIAALYIIAGGIDLETPACGSPRSNVLFLLAGGVLANLLGTTGASMVLIRPLIRANARRHRVRHLYVFFIIIVSNIGGLLTPLGDPPLFLGFLHGVPFFWTLRLFPFWLLAIVFLLVVFWLWDGVVWRRERSGQDLLETGAGSGFTLRGKRNIGLLGLVIGGLFLPVVARDLVLVAATMASLMLTPREIRQRNDFTYHPIREVAILFAGIFATLIPVQVWIRDSGLIAADLSPSAAFWFSGLLSSILDNAPTYLVFFESSKHAAMGLADTVAGVPSGILTAIATGCVMMGANTYIGNGPNLMVKVICEDEGIPMPSFLAYSAWALLLLLPVYGALTVLAFLR